MPSIFEKYQLKQVINASGRMTALGVSTPRPEVIDAAMAGMNQYFEMKDLVNKTGEYIAKLLEVEGATVVSCASAGLAQSVAAVLVQDSDWLLENLHVTPIENNEIVLPKGGYSLYQISPLRTEKYAQRGAGCGGGAHA